jgi:NADH-quinone oxidoreductase subunit L
MSQWDIKKVLAYSTVSQLGFMVAACGIGAYTAAIFHLLTHAFFKALLFLGSGSVIHGLEHNPKTATHADGAHGGAHHGVDPQDMRNMGGLKSRMKITFFTYLIGGLALAGIPPLAGFWSKDEILAASSSNLIVFALLAVTAVLTAFYTMRQIRLVFFGEPRSKEAWHTIENGPQMTVPLIILAIFSIGAGALINWPFEFGLTPHALSHFLEPVFGKLEVIKFDWTKAIVFSVLALVSMAAAYLIYRSNYNERQQEEPLEKLGPLYALSKGKFFLDDIYRVLIVIPFYGAASVFAQVIEKNGIDAIVNGVGNAVRNAAGTLREIQTGFVRSYGLVMLLGVVVIVAWFVFAR